MLTIILRILGILGILLLCLAGLLLTAVLLVLFLPVAYRFEGRRDESALAVKFKIRWLFGLLRIDYQYPEPGALRAKLLWFTIYDSTVQPSDSQQPDDHKKKQKKQRRGGEEEAKQEKDPEQSKEIKQGRKEHEKELPPNKDEDWEYERLSGPAAEEPPGKEKASHEGQALSAEPSRLPEEMQERQEKAKAQNGGENAQNGSEEDESGSEEKQTGQNTNTTAEGPIERLIRWITSKYEKLKYTIGKICDKIKNISEQQTYYKEVLLNEETKLLFGHGLLRIKKMLRSIRPRKLSADIVFGAGSPDITGYALGVYCMFYPVLGQNINITPDFDNAVLKGRVFAAGHVMAAVLVYHVLRLLADKRLRVFIRKMKREET